ncbi:MAG: hypothetical protein EA414_20495 [Arthrospira sp. PLM2.Bin9]|nr:hypothetical protein [Arthrospira sp. PLM2.Bin9]TVU51871.1 MAG: hypothetical protein EA414_20495 [Arthrospira sp. PLM2.Bin9]
MKLHNLTVASGLALLSAIAFAPQAVADPVTIDAEFEGIIGTVCVFSELQNGTLAKDDDNDNQWWLEASAGTDAGNLGEAGAVTINCNTGGTVTVAQPVQLAAPAAFNGTIAHAVVYGPEGQLTTSGTRENFDWWPNDTDDLQIPNAQDLTLRIAMIVGDNRDFQPVPNGVYRYSVTITATPN